MLFGGLIVTPEDMEESIKMQREMHTAFFEGPAGSPEGTKPLIEGMRIMWAAYQRGSWAFRAIVWLLPAIAGVGIAAEKIHGWFVK
jgi:hypothetical protein